MMDETQNTLTQEQGQELHKKALKLDKYAKSLGITLYYFKAGVIINGVDWLWSDSHLNKMPDKWKDEF